MEAARMRVLIASHAYADGERFKLLEELAAEHEVSLLAPERIPTAVHSHLFASDRIWTPVHWRLIAQESSGRVTVVPNRALRVFGGHFVFRPSVRTWWRLCPDVLQVEYDPWTPAFWSVVLPVLVLQPRTPIVLYSKKNTRHIHRGPLGMLERLLTRLGLARVRLILATSGKTAAIFDRLGYDNIPTWVQAHLAIDEAVFAPPSGTQRLGGEESGVFTVGYVGQIALYKGIRTLVEAVGLTRRRLAADVRVAFVGPMRDSELADLFASLPWVDYWGPCDNAEVPGFLAMIDAFVMPSKVLPDHEEHDAQALLEAMATERACVGSRSGIIPELIEDLHTGLLFNPDDAEGLADCLEKLCTDPELRYRLGENARTAALQRSGLRSLVAQRLDAYRKVWVG
jgi:glycosyltransferase involved in cell wall biosynthesis